MPTPKSTAQGRADFLNASKSAAIAETHRKEDRALHKLLQTQIDLGRIKLPAEANAAPTDANTAEEAAEHEQRVQRHKEWLLAVHRGAAPIVTHSQAEAAGSVAELSAAPLAGEAEGQGSPVAVAAMAGANAEQAAEAAEAAAKAEAEAHIRGQLRDISRALWGAISAGAASGQTGGASRNRSDYAFQPEAVDAMWREGELDARHRRRRDEHAAYVEAAARDALLRRGAGGGAKEAK